MKLTAQLRRWLAGGLILAGTIRSAADVSLVLSAPPDALGNAGVKVWVIALNDGAQPVEFEFAPRVETEVTAKSWSAPAALQLRAGQPSRVTLAPGAFERREYAGPLPEKRTDRSKSPSVRRASCSPRPPWPPNRSPLPRPQIPARP